MVFDNPCTVANDPGGPARKLWMSTHTYLETEWLSDPLFAGIAGHLTTDQEVGGSNPSGYAIFSFIYRVKCDLPFQTLSSIGSELTLGLTTECDLRLRNI